MKFVPLISTIAMVQGDCYERIGHVSTVSGARTSLYLLEVDALRRRARVTRLAGGHVGVPADPLKGMLDHGYYRILVGALAALLVVGAIVAF